jgi:rod shape-determining protein MreD
MIGLLIKNIARFIFLILFQVLVFNEVTLLSGWAQPYIYIYFILVLPFNIPKRLMLPIGFLTGLTMDFFTHTPGIHASAVLTMAFARPYVLKAIRPREGYESIVPSIKNMGSTKFFTYAVILIFIHHLWLFSLLYFSSHLWFYIIGHVVVSTLFTLVLTYLLQLFAQKQTIV